MTGRKHSIIWLAVFVMLPGLLRGQCEPLPLPYTTDLITGFQPPSDSTELVYPWTEGLNSDNCWAGYLDFGDAVPYPYIRDANSARGRFGFNDYVDGVSWPQYAEIAVKDSTHHGMAMLIAPEFVTAPAAIRVHGRLERYFNPAAPYPPGGEEERYWGRLEMGWVTDMAHPDESFLHTGTFAIRTFTLSDTSLYHWCIPLHGNPPAGSHFALRMRSKAQGPAQNYVSTNFFYYEFEIWRITMDTATCPPPQSTDTVYITDSICQHSLYQRNGIALAASETADTGTRIFVIHEYEFFSSDSCLCHVKVLTLRVLPSELTFVRDSIFPGEAYTFFGRELTLAGNYGVDRGLNAYGCPIGDSLQLSIRSLPPISCGAEIGVERTEYYISQPTEVHLWSVDEADRYLWHADGLTDDGTQRDAYVVLQSESVHQVWLEVERIDTVDHIYQGAAIDTSFVWTYSLTVPVEPQTRYRLVAVADTSAVGLSVQGHAPESTVWRDSVLMATFFTNNYREVTLTFSTTVPVRLSRLSLRRYCHDNDMVILTANSLQPRIVADRTIICQGDNAVLQAIQTDYYRWESNPADTAVDSCVGCRSLTVSPSSTTTYYLLTPGGAVADSVVIEVQPYPVLHVVADREVVKLDNPVLTLEEQTAEVVSVRWIFSDGGEAGGHKVRWIFGCVDGDSLWVRVEGCSAAGCCTDSLLTFPVEILSAWFPNTFTPDGETNNRFTMVATKAVEAYEMTIYNRQGLLVARCTDAAAGWDGRDGLGRACPQGVYTYICKYRLAGGFAKRYLGSVALLR